jgi:hypothetical protein
MDNFKNMDEEILKLIIRNEILDHELKKTHNKPDFLMIIIFLILAIGIITSIIIHFIL